MRSAVEQRVDRPADARVHRHPGPAPGAAASWRSTRPRRRCAPRWSRPRWPAWPWSATSSRSSRWPPRRPSGRRGGRADRPALHLRRSRGGVRHRAGLAWRRDGVDVVRPGGGPVRRDARRRVARSGVRRPGRAVAGARPHARDRRGHRGRGGRPARARLRRARRSTCHRPCSPTRTPGWARGSRSVTPAACRSRDACCDNAFFVRRPARDPRRPARARRGGAGGAARRPDRGDRGDRRRARSRPGGRAAAGRAAPVRPRRQPGPVAAAGAAAGLRIVESRDLMSHSRGDSPNTLADLIEQRAWSQSVARGRRGVGRGGRAGDRTAARAARPRRPARPADALHAPVGVHPLTPTGGRRVSGSAPARRRRAGRRPSRGRATSSSCGPRCTTRPRSTTITSSARLRGGQPVRDRDRGAAPGHRVERALQPHLGGRVDRAGRLVEHQQVGVGDVRPGQRDQLPLPHAAAPRRARPTGVSRPAGSASHPVGQAQLGEGQLEVVVGQVRAGRSARSPRPSRRTGTRPAAPSPPGERSDANRTSVSGTPDSSTAPAVGSISRVSSFANVVLPLPVSPTTATRVCAGDRPGRRRCSTVGPPG